MRVSVCVFAYGAGEKRRNKDKRTQSNIVAKTKANMTPTNKNQTKNRLLRDERPNISYF